MAPIKPYLSIVATARNDDHGGNLLGRMQLFIDGLLEQCSRFNLPAELIIVEWNPPSDRPRLVEALNWPNYGGACTVRLIEVPHHIHKRFAHSDSLPLFQMIGKNVGIHRSNGKFVLATNIDILFSDELMQFIAQQQLRENRAYRIDRCDADSQVPVNASVRERLHYCDNNLIRLEQCDGTLDLRTEQFHRIYWKPTWKVRLLEKLQDNHLVPIVTRTRLHLNACGDFTLMARPRWDRLRGYPEFEMYSMHLDSVLCTQAHFDGTRELVLRKPMRIYHIEHGTGSGFTPEGHDELNSRLAASGIPQLRHEEFHKWAITMRRERKPMIFNDDNWGLRNDTLTETNPFAATNRNVNAIPRETCMT